jgi:hypothetical protein
VARPAGLLRVVPQFGAFLAPVQRLDRVVDVQHVRLGQYPDLREIIRPARNVFVDGMFSFAYKEHTEALRALHQIGEGQASDLIARNQLMRNHFNKSSSIAKRLNCSL